MFICLREIVVHVTATFEVPQRADVAQLLDSEYVGPLARLVRVTGRWRLITILLAAAVAITSFTRLRDCVGECQERIILLLVLALATVLLVAEVVATFRVVHSLVRYVTVVRALEQLLSALIMQSKRLATMIVLFTQLRCLRLVQVVTRVWLATTRDDLLRNLVRCHNSFLYDIVMGAFLNEADRLSNLLLMLIVGLEDAQVW